MQLLINALIAGSLAALLAGGLALVFGILGVYNFALGQTALFGGYVAWWLFRELGLPLWIALIGGVLGGVLVSWLTYDIFMKPFYKYHKRLPLVTTIALGIILDGIILLLFEERPRTILSGIKQVVHIGDAVINIPQIILIVATVILLTVLAWMMHGTIFGRRIRAVVQHEHAAYSLGIPAGSLHRLIVLSSGALAACGGIFLGIDQNLSPTIAFPLTIKAYAAVVAGGMNNVWGAVVCAYAIALLEQLTVGVHWFGLYYIPAGYQSVVPLVVLIGFLLIRPQGLFGSVQRSS